MSPVAVVIDVTDEMVDRAARALGGYHAEDGYTDEDWAACGDAYELRTKARMVINAALDSSRCRNDQRRRLGGGCEV